MIDYLDRVEWAGDEAKEEVVRGLKLLNEIEKEKVTFFGSHLIGEDHDHYQHAYGTAERFARDGYAVLSGGGPGIMQAANEAADGVGAVSVGLREGELAQEESVDEDIYTHLLSFHFMFVRRFILSIGSEALIFYPGGYGTLNELFEYAVLIQTGLMEEVPVICVGTEYWDGLFDWIRQNLVEHELLTNHIDDLNILHVVDDRDEIFQLLDEY